MPINQLIAGRIQQATSRRDQAQQKANRSNCLTERIKQKANAARAQAIIDEYEILNSQIRAAK